MLFKSGNQAPTPTQKYNGAGWWWWFKSRGAPPPPPELLVAGLKPGVHRAHLDHTHACEEQAVRRGGEEPRLCLWTRGGLRALGPRNRL